MHRRKTKIDSTVRSFVKRIRTHFKPTKIILFGSRASREFFNYSDYDFIIVSNLFENVHWLNRISSIIKFWNSDRDIDILPYSNKEFEEKKLNSSVVQEAVRKGIEL